MRSLTTRLVVEPARSSSVHEWLSSQLELYGFEANYASRSVLNIATRDFGDERPRISSFGDKHEAHRSTASHVHEFGDWDDQRQWTCEDRKKMAITDCLKRLSPPEEWIIHRLAIQQIINELLDKLEQEKNLRDNNEASRAQKAVTCDEVESSSPQDVAARYYAAFPSLSDKCDLLATNSAPFDAEWSRVAQMQPRSVSSMQQLDDSGIHSSSDRMEKGGVRKVACIPGNSRNTKKMKSSYGRRNYERTQQDGGRRGRQPRSSRHRSNSSRSDQTRWSNAVTSVMYVPMTWVQIGPSFMHSESISFWNKNSDAGVQNAAACSDDIEEEAADCTSYKDKFTNLKSCLWSRPSFENETSVAGNNSGPSRSFPMWLFPNNFMPLPVNDADDVQNAGQGNTSFKSSSAFVSKSLSAVSQRQSTGQCVDRLGNFLPATCVADADKVGNSEQCCSQREVSSRAITQPSVSRSTTSQLLGCYPLDPEMWDILCSDHMNVSKPLVVDSVASAGQNAPKCSKLQKLTLNISDYTGLKAVQQSDSSPSNGFPSPSWLTAVSENSQSQTEKVVVWLNNNLSCAAEHTGYSSPTLSDHLTPETELSHLELNSPQPEREAWDGTRIADAVKGMSTKDPVALDAEAIRKIWLPSKSSPVETEGHTDADSGKVHDGVWQDDVGVMGRMIYEKLSDVNVSSSLTVYWDNTRKPSCDGGQMEVNHPAMWDSQLYSLSFVGDCPTEEQFIANSSVEDSVLHKQNKKLTAGSTEDIFDNSVDSGLNNEGVSGMADICSVYSCDTSHSNLKHDEHDHSEDEPSSHMPTLLTGDINVHNICWCFNGPINCSCNSVLKLVPSVTDGLWPSDGCMVTSLRYSDQPSPDAVSTCETLLSSSDEQVVPYDILVPNPDDSTQSNDTACDLLMHLVEENNNVKCDDEGCCVTDECYVNCDTAVHPSDVLSVSDVSISDSEADLSFTQSISDISVFSSDPSEQHLGAHVFDCCDSDSLLPISSCAISTCVLNLGIETVHTMGGLNGDRTLTGPVYNVSGSSMWLRDTQFVSASIDALSRLHLHGTQPLFAAWASPPKLSHHSVCSAIAKCGRLMPSENTAFRDNIPQKISSLPPVSIGKRLPLTEAGMCASSSSSFPYWLWSARGGLLSLKMPFSQGFRPIGTPSNSDSESEECSSPSLSVTGTTDTSVVTTNACNRVDAIGICCDPGAVYQQFIVNENCDYEETDGCHSFRPSFKVRSELEKAAQTGEPSPVVSSLDGDTDQRTSELVSFMLRQLSNEFPERYADSLENNSYRKSIINDDDKLKELDGDAGLAGGKSDAPQLSGIWDGPNRVSDSSEDESQTDKAVNKTLTIPAHLAKIWDSVTESSIECHLDTDTCDAMPDRISEIWKEPAATVLDENSVAVKSPNQHSDIWSPRDTVKATDDPPAGIDDDVLCSTSQIWSVDTAYSGPSYKLVPSELSAIWSDTRQPGDGAEVRGAAFSEIPSLAHIWNRTNELEKTKFNEDIKHSSDQLGKTVDSELEGDSKGQHQGCDNADELEYGSVDVGCQISSEPVTCSVTVEGVTEVENDKNGASDLNASAADTSGDERDSSKWFICGLGGSFQNSDRVWLDDKELTAANSETDAGVLCHEALKAIWNKPVDSTSTIRHLSEQTDDTGVRHLEVDDHSRPKATGECLADNTEDSAVRVTADSDVDLMLTHLVTGILEIISGATSSKVEPFVSEAPNSSADLPNSACMIDWPNALLRRGSLESFVPNESLSGHHGSTSLSFPQCFSADWPLTRTRTSHPSFTGVINRGLHPSHQAFADVNTSSGLASHVLTQRDYRQNADPLLVCDEGALGSVLCAFMSPAGSDRGDMSILSVVPPPVASSSTHLAPRCVESFHKATTKTPINLWS